MTDDRCQMTEKTEERIMEDGGALRLRERKSEGGKEEGSPAFAL
jgi:hypothetical protein